MLKRWGWFIGCVFVLWFGAVFLHAQTGIRLTSGYSDPNGRVVGSYGSMFLCNCSGEAKWYQKQSAGNVTTGWVEFTSGGGGGGGEWGDITGTLSDQTDLQSALDGKLTIAALGSGVATFLGTPSSANFAAAVTGETGSGAVVFSDSPTISRWVWTAATGVMMASSDAGTGSSLLHWVPGASNTQFYLRRTDADTFFRMSDLSEQQIGTIRYGVTASPRYWSFTFNDEVSGHASVLRFTRATDDVTEQVQLLAHDGSTFRGLRLLRTGAGLFDGILQTGGYKSADGTEGVTVTTCTGFKNGLCISGT